MVQLRDQISFLNTLSSLTRVKILDRVFTDGPYEFNRLRESVGFYGKNEYGSFAHHLRKLLKDEMIYKMDDGRYQITNTGKLGMFMVKTVFDFKENLNNAIIKNMMEGEFKINRALPYLEKSLKDMKNLQGNFEKGLEELKKYSIDKIPIEIKQENIKPFRYYMPMNVIEENTVYIGSQIMNLTNEKFKTKFGEKFIDKCLQFYLKFNLIQKSNNYGYQIKKKPSQELIKMLYDFNFRNSSRIRPS